MGQGRSTSATPDLTTDPLKMRTQSMDAFQWVHGSFTQQGKGATEKTPLTYEEEMELKETFGLYDMDGDGKITEDEIHKITKSLGIEVTKAELKQLIALMDKDGDGEIDYPEFSDWFLQMTATKRKETAILALRSQLAMNKTENSFLKKEVQELRRVIGAEGENVKTAYEMQYRSRTPASRTRTPAQAENETAKTHDYYEEEEEILVTFSKPLKKYVDNTAQVDMENARRKAERARIKERNAIEDMLEAKTSTGSHRHRSWDRHYTAPRALLIEPERPKVDIGEMKRLPAPSPR